MSVFHLLTSVRHACQEQMHRSVCQIPSQQTPASQLRADVTLSSCTWSFSDLNSESKSVTRKGTVVSSSLHFVKAERNHLQGLSPPLLIGIDLVRHGTHVCAVVGSWYFLEKCLLPWKVPQVCPCVMFPSRLFLTLIHKRPKKSLELSTPENAFGLNRLGSMLAN